MHPNMQMSCNAYYKLCSLIEHNIVNRICTFIHGKILAEQTVIDAFSNIIVCNQQNTRDNYRSLMDCCMSELNKALTDKVSLYLSVVNAYISVYNNSNVVVTGDLNFRKISGRDQLDDLLMSTKNNGAYKEPSQLAQSTCKYTNCVFHKHCTSESCKYYYKNK